MADKSSKSTRSSNTIYGQSPEPYINPQTLTSASSSPLELKTYNELCVADENLPSRNIAELWQKPLKLSEQLRKSDSPNAQYSERKKDQYTPNRKNVLPPTKLVFDSNELYKVSRVSYRRSLSLPGDSSSNSDTPVYNPKRLKLVKDERSPYEDLINSKVILKESNENVQFSATSSLTPAIRKLFSKSQSDNVLSKSIKKAVEKIEEDSTLIGDASTSYILPFLSNGNHPDLKEITGETLAKLIEAKEDYPQVSFKIIDCRYPYEFAGGHIRGAVNFYTKLQIQKELVDSKLEIRSPSGGNEKDTREILIFHCEFSSQRGPHLCRHLRHLDRASNASLYPFLFYPELYVLYEGYKEFFENFPHLCDPQSYITMRHPKYTNEYRQFKSTTKL